MESDFLITSGVAIVCFVYTLLIFLLFMLKKKSSKISSVFYLILLVCTVFSIGFYVLNSYFSLNDFSFSLFTGRFLSFTICVWEFLFMLYVTFAFNSEDDNRKIFSNNKTLIIILNIIMVVVNALLSIILDLQYVKKANGLPLGMGGTLVTYYNVLGILAIVYTLIIMIIKRKNVTKHGAVLFLFAIIGSIFSFLLEMIIHEPVNDVPFSQAIVIFFLYLSLESQDASLLNAYNKAIEDEKQMDKLKSEFILGMSHKLRTPMNVILGLSDSIINNTSDNIKDDLYNINYSSKSLLDLVNSVHDLSSVQSNLEKLDLKDYKLENVICDLSVNINSNLKENIIFNINVDEICPNELYGDDFKLHKVLYIVVNSLVSHIEYGEVNLNVSCNQIDTSNYEFIFLFKSFGNMFNKVMFDINFDDLIKLNNKNNVIDTNALKLVVCKNLIELMGGNIEFVNDDQGIQCVIKLKQKVTSKNTIGSIKDKIQFNNIVNDNIKNISDKKVLIIDDNKVNIVVLKRLFNKFNCNIESVFSPKDGLDLINNNNYDLVIVSNDIEEMTGEDFVNKLYSTGNRVPNIIGVVNDKKVYSYFSDVLLCPIEFKKINTIINKYFS